MLSFRGVQVFPVGQLKCVAQLNLVFIFLGRQVKQILEREFLNKIFDCREFIHVCEAAAVWARCTSTIGRRTFRIHVASYFIKNLNIQAKL